MAVISDIVGPLHRWDVWRRVEAVPDGIDALEKRVTELEATVNARPAPETCPIREEGRLKVVGVQRHPVFRDGGWQIRRMGRTACSRTEDRDYNRMGPIGNR